MKRPGRTLSSTPRQTITWGCLLPPSGVAVTLLYLLRSPAFLRSNSLFSSYLYVPGLLRSHFAQALAKQTTCTPFLY